MKKTKKVKTFRDECKDQLMKNNKKNFGVTVATVFADSLANIGIAFIMKYIADAMQAMDYSLLMRAVAIAVVVAGVALSFSIVQKTYRNRYLKHGLSQFKRFIFEKILDKSIGDYADTSSAKFISAFSNDLGQIEGNYLAANIQFFYQTSLLVGGVIAMAVISPIMMAAVMGATVVPTVVSLLYGRKMTAVEKKTSSKNEGFVDQMKDLLNGFIVIKSFRAEKEVMSLFNQQFPAGRSQKEPPRNARQGRHYQHRVADARHHRAAVLRHLPRVQRAHDHRLRTRVLPAAKLYARAAHEACTPLCQPQSRRRPDI